MRCSVDRRRNRTGRQRSDLVGRGRLIGDFTLCRASADGFFVVGTYAAEVFYMRWFEQHLPPTGKGRQSQRRLNDRDIGAMSIYIQLNRQIGDQQ